MRITAITARTVRWPIAATGAALGRDERAAVLIEVRTDRGIIGLGEAAPLPGLSPDILGDAGIAIAAVARNAPFDVVARPFDATCPDAEGAFLKFVTYPFARIAAYAAPFQIMNEWVARFVPRIPPAPRFAIETAVCDALARDRSMSLASWLADRLATGPARAVAALPLAAVVDDADAARAAYAAGVRCLKIKQGASDPPSRVLAIAAAAPEARLRIDANRSWPPAEVAARLAALAALPIDYVEEPCRDAHRLLATALPCRIALDESLGELSVDELDAALASPQLAAVILKPTLLGGLGACLTFAARARAAGVRAIVSHGLEGPIGTAACAELALALGGDDSPHAAPVGLASHAALAGWSIQVAQLAADHVRPTGAPGLGFVGLDLAGAVTACPTTDRAVADTARQG